MKQKKKMLFRLYMRISKNTVNPGAEASPALLTKQFQTANTQSVLIPNE